MHRPLGHPARWLGSPWSRGAAAALAGALPALTFPAPSWWWLAYVALVPWLLLVRSAPTRGPGGTGRLAGRRRVHARRPSLAAAEPARLHPRAGPVPRRSVGTVGAAGAGAAVGRARRGAARRRPGAGAVGLVDGRTGQVLGGIGRPLGAAGREPVAAATRFAARVDRRRMAAEPADRGGEHRCRRADRPAGGLAARPSPASWSAPSPPPRPGTGPPSPGPPVRCASRWSSRVSPAAPKAGWTRSEELTRALAGRGVRLVVWGESSLNRDPADHPALAARLAALSRRTGAELLVNADAPHAGGPGIYKSAVLIGPTGRPVTGTPRCGWCPSVSTSRPDPSWAGRRRSARPPPPTGCGAPARS